MRKSDVAYLLGCAFLSLFSLAYCSTIWFHLKLPRYYPLEHIWKLIKEQGVPSQGWYGMVAFALVSSAVLTFLVYAVGRSFWRRGKQPTPACTKTIGAISVLILLACMAYVAIHEFSKWGILGP
jgi:hypothetical protein